MKVCYYLIPMFYGIAALGICFKPILSCFSIHVCWANSLSCKFGYDFHVFGFSYVKDDFRGFLRCHEFFSLLAIWSLFLRTFFFSFLYSLYGFVAFSQVYVCCLYCVYLGHMNV